MTRRGFTLIELMAAVLISSIVVAAAFTLMTGSTDNFDDENERRKLKSNLRIAELLLQRDISRTGYMVPVDSTVQSKLLWSNNASDQILAFTYHPISDRFSAFTIIASLSDHLDFQVERMNGQNICILPQLTMPLTAADIGNLGTNANPVSQNADDATFFASFTRNFNNELQALSIQNPNGEYVTTRVNDVIIPAAPTGASCAFQIQLNAPNSAPAGTTGFEGSNFLEGCNIFPISAISYFVTPDENGINNLMRCENDPFNLRDIDDLMQENRCQTLIPNIQYFEAFPLQLTRTTNIINAPQSFSNALTGNNGVLSNVVNEGVQQGEWTDLRISDLRGVYFRLGAATRNPVTSGITIDPTINNGSIYPAYVKINNEWHQYEHIRGAAAFRIAFPSEVNSSQTLVVAQ